MIACSNITVTKKKPLSDTEKTLSGPYFGTEGTLETLRYPEFGTESSEKTLKDLKVGTEGSAKIPSDPPGFFITEVQVMDMFMDVLSTVKFERCNSEKSPPVHWKILVSQSVLEEQVERQLQVNYFLIHK